MFCLRRPYHFKFLKAVFPATLLKKEILAQVFFCKFCEISKNISFTKHFQTTASANLTYNNLISVLINLFITKI